MSAEIKIEENRRINEELCALYRKYTPDFLEFWSEAFGKAPPSRINEFGIVDALRYRTGEGILFIGRETNDWRDEDFLSGCLFRGWLEDISRNGLSGHGHVRKHPNVWYNIGRWAMLLRDPARPVEELSNLKEEALTALGTIAFTNVNKVRGGSVSGRSYYRIAKSDIAQQLLREEVELLRPAVIVCCGTWYPVGDILPEYAGKILSMPHPGARRSKKKMLLELKEKVKQLTG